MVFMGLYFLDDAVNGGSGDTTGPGDHDQCWTSDDPAFQACSPHAGANPFGDQASLQLGDNANDDFCCFFPLWYIDFAFQ
jgi:hypothetical protein